MGKNRAENARSLSRSSGSKVAQPTVRTEYSSFPLMKTFALLSLTAGLFAQPHPVAPKKPAAATEIAKASQAVPAEAKVKKSEALHYNVNWPSGLSLGEADLTSSAGDSSLSFTFRL